MAGVNDDLMTTGDGVLYKSMSIVMALVALAVGVSNRLSTATRGHCFGIASDDPLVESIIGADLVSKGERFGQVCCSVRSGRRFGWTLEQDDWDGTCIAIDKTIIFRSGTRIASVQQIIS